MRTITRLPSRPFQGQYVAALDDVRFQVSPNGGTVRRDEIRIYAIKITTNTPDSALKSDESWEQRQHLASVNISDLTVADGQLDAVLDD